MSSNLFLFEAGPEGKVVMAAEDPPACEPAEETPTEPAAAAADAPVAAEEAPKAE